MTVDAAHGSATRTRLIVTVCTFRRNEPLRAMLDATARAADRIRDRAAVGVVVVDDNKDGAAAPVVSSFEGRFELGVHYRTSGRGNISLCRNICLETAMELGDWIVMTDDDCEPVEEWLESYLDRALRDTADAFTGPCVLRPPAGSPGWLTDEPFMEDAQLRFPDDSEMPVAATNNSMIRASFVRDHADLRFLPELGVVGGEDMVFYRSAVKRGLRIRFVERAVVHGNESPARATFGYQLRSRFWLGNTEYVTNMTLGDATRFRMLLRGGKRLVQAVARPLLRLARRERPQLRYCIVSIARAAGTMAGALGLRLRHH